MGVLYYSYLKHLRMNNYILIHRTYAETTPESVEIGGFSDTGFIEYDQKVTFTELVELMRDYPHPSASPNDGSTVWFSTSSYTSDYRTGTERVESLHYSHNNPPNCAKYWLLAHTAAQLANERRKTTMLDIYEAEDKLIDDIIEWENELFK